MSFSNQMYSYHAKLAGVDTDTFKLYILSKKCLSVSAGITTNQIMEATDWKSESVFKRYCYKPANSNQVGQAVLSSSSTDSLQTSRWLCDPSILKCNYLNGSDHEMIASYSGMWGEHINVLPVDMLMAKLPTGVQYIAGSCNALIATITPISNCD